MAGEKTSYRTAKSRAKLDRQGFIRKAIIAVAAVVLIMTIIVIRHELGGTAQKAASVPAPAPTQAAPAAIKYYNPAEGEGYETGQGYVILHRSDDTSIRVDADGNVWYVDKDGKEYRLTGVDASDALNTVQGLMKDDYAVQAAMGDTFTENLNKEPEPEPVQEPTETAQERTARILEEDYGITLDDFYKQLYAGGASTQEYYDLVDQGYDANELIKAAMSVKTESTAASASGDSESMMPEFMKAGLAEDTDTYTESADEGIPDWLTMGMDDSMNAMLSNLSSGLSAGSSTAQAANWDMVNQNSAKQNWYDAQQASGTVTQTARLTDRDIAPGSIIPITLLTGINSDLPGEVVGLVRQDVYDTLTGRNILIPKGSRVMATYNSSVSFGQHSIQIAWNQLITTDGRIYSLPGFNGTTPDGYSGVKDKYSDHFWSILGGAILGSIVDMGAGYVKEQADAASAIAGTQLISALSGQAIDTTQNFVDKYANLAVSRQPTVTIRTGQQLNMLVNRVFRVE